MSHIQSPDLFDSLNENVANLSISDYNRSSFSPISHAMQRNLNAMTTASSPISHVASTSSVAHPPGYMSAPIMAASSTGTFFGPTCVASANAPITPSVYRSPLGQGFGNVPPSGPLSSYPYPGTTDFNVPSGSSVYPGPGFGAPSGGFTNHVSSLSGNHAPPGSTGYAPPGFHGMMAAPTGPPNGGVLSEGPSSFDFNVPSGSSGYPGPGFGAPSGGFTNQVSNLSGNHAPPGSTGYAPPGFHGMMAAPTGPPNGGVLSEGPSSFERHLQAFNMRLSHAMRISLNPTSSYELCSKALSALEGAFDALVSVSLTPGADVGDNMTQASDDYLGAAHELSYRKEALRPSGNDSQGSAPPNASVNQTMVQAPMCQVKKMETPKWDGGFRSYLSFRSRFKATIERYVDAENALLRLRDESIDSSTHAYHMVKAKSTLEEAWKALDEYYANPRMLRSIILKDLKNIPSVPYMSDSKALRNMVTELTSAREDLTSIKQEDVLGEYAISELLVKLPPQIRSKIDNKIIDNEYSASEMVTVFIAVCERQALLNETHLLRSDALETVKNKRDQSDKSKSWEIPKRSQKRPNPAALPAKVSNNGKSKHANPGISKQPSFGVSDSQSPGAIRCIFHPWAVNHSTSQCSRVHSMPLSELRNTFTEHKVCWRCMWDHPTQNCRSTITCPEPGCPNPTTHCRTLHLESKNGDVNRESKKSEGKKFPSQQMESVTEEEVDTRSPSHSMSSIPEVQLSSVDLEVPAKSASEQAQFDTQLGLNTIRPCHNAYVRLKNGKFRQVQLLYDSGADLSQVLNSIVTDTGLQPVNVLPELLINVAGGKEATSFGKSELHVVPIYDEFGTCVTRLDCVAVEYIGETSPGAYDHVASKFSDFDLSELMDPGEGPIGILVGCNFVNLHPAPLCTVGTVVLAETRFGKLMYGSDPSFPRQNYSRKTVSHNLGTALQLSRTAWDLASGDLDRDGNSITARSRSDSCPPAVPDDVTSSNVCVSSLATHDSEILYSSAQPHVMATLSQQEKDVFDKMVTIDDQISCFRCGKCPPECTPQSKEEARRRDVYRDCLTYDPDNQIFRTKMPWISDFTNLPDNRFAAEKRLVSLTKSLAHDQAMRDRYIEEFNKIIENGVLKKVSENEDRSWINSGGKVWYVAHFPVMNESSASTPLRVVFDPTLPYKGIHLSDLWESPPNLIPDIPKMILSFRENSVPINLDIQKAYWSVHLELPESHLHRVLFNNLDPNAETQTYRMCRNSWGMKPAGSLCSMAMISLAEMYRSEYPQVHNFILHQMYVDDGVYSVSSVEDALSLARDICHVMAKGNFHIKHFIIGGRAVDVTSDSPQWSDTPEIVRFGGDTERVLGLEWFPGPDQLGFIVRINFSKKKRGAKTGPNILEDQYDEHFPAVLTKRMYLSQIASLYDPTGLASAYTIILKHELGRIFALETDWDDPIPHSDDDSKANHQRCKEILKSLFDLAKIRFPRCLRPLSTPEDAKPVLVVFCDASDLAYGAILYFNWPTPEGPRATVLVCAKARPVPRKGPLVGNTPRGELCGMLVGIRTLKSTLLNSRIEFDRTLILSDSTIVLCQLWNSPSKFKPWVASRLDEIRQDSSLDDFFHVSSANNAADDVTRGLHPCDMGVDSRYQNGPTFMIQPVETWPIKPVSEIAVKVGEKPDVDLQMEVRSKDPRMTVTSRPTNQPSVHAVSAVTTTNQNVINCLLTLDIPEPCDGDSWFRLRRKVARIIHFCSNIGQLLKLRNGQKLPENFSTLSRQEQRTFINENDNFAPSPEMMELAEIYWVLRAQKSVKSGSEKRFSALNIVQDGNGAWKVLGRTFDPISAPYLIPGDHPLARVLMTHYHSIAHSGAQSTQARLREHFWVTNGANIARSIVSSCCRCRFLRKTLTQVEIAPLKDYRLAQSQVFEVVSLDLCGPYITKADRRTTRANPASAGKVWVLVLVCAASGALHLETVEAYDTANFLAALDNFISLRGKPKKFICDRGSQIVSAGGTVESLWEAFDIQQCRNHLCVSSQFEFVPSGAHSFLGHAERMVRAFKEALLTATYSDKPLLTKLVFSRLLYSIASLINDRPLAVGRCQVSQLEDSLIRPNDLILGHGLINESPILDVENVEMSAKKRHYAELLRQKYAFLNAFWQKWYKVVFPTLVSRPKWSASGHRELQPGDLVLVKDTNPIRNQWKWGEVAEVSKSVDSKVRRATVRYKCGTKSKFVEKSVRDLALLMKVEERR